MNDNELRRLADISANQLETQERILTANRLLVAMVGFILAANIVAIVVMLVLA